MEVLLLPTGDSCCLLDECRNSFAVQATVSSSPELCFDSFPSHVWFPTAHCQADISSHCCWWLASLLFGNPNRRYDWAMSVWLTGLYTQRAGASKKHWWQLTDMWRQESKWIWQAEVQAKQALASAHELWGGSGASPEFEFGAWSYWDAWRGGKEGGTDEQTREKRDIREGNRKKKNTKQKEGILYLPHQRCLLWALLFSPTPPHLKKEITFVFQAVITSLPRRKNSLLSLHIHRANQISSLAPSGDSYQSC